MKYLSWILVLLMSLPIVFAQDVTSGAAAGFSIIFFLIQMVFFLLFPLVGLAALGFWIWMVVDVIQRKNFKKDEQLMWILIVVLAGVIGAIIYYFMIKRQR